MSSFAGQIYESEHSTLIFWCGCMEDTYWKDGDQGSYGHTKKMTKCKSHEGPLPPINPNTERQLRFLDQCIEQRTNTLKALDIRFDQQQRIQKLERMLSLHNIPLP